MNKIRGECREAQPNFVIRRYEFRMTAEEGRRMTFGHQSNVYETVNKQNVDQMARLWTNITSNSITEDN